MTRIIFSVTNDLSYDRRMQRICSSLAANGFEVILIGRKLKASLPLSKAGFTQHRLVCVFNKGKLFYLEYNLRLFLKLLFTNADIYGAVDLDTIIPAFLVAKIKGKPKVFDAHEYFSEVPEVIARPLVKKVWERIAKTFIPMSDLATTVSQTLADIFSIQYDVPFETIRNVPVLQPVEVNTPGSYLLYQGALNEGRGLEQLIESMLHIDMPLKIVGEGDLSIQLRQRVQDLKLTEKIEFMGFVEPKRLNEITAHAFIGFNLLEQTGKSYYYSLANKFFDYIVNGVPSINMNFPEYQNINETHAVSLLIDRLNVESIIESVNKLVTDKQLYYKLKSNCRAAREIYAWGKEERKLLTLYSRFEK